MSKMGCYSPFQEIRETDVQVYYLRDSETGDDAHWLERYGTGTTYINAALPEARMYTSAGGTTAPIGLLPSARDAVAGDDTDEQGTNRRKERFITPVKKADIVMYNYSGSDVSINDGLAPMSCSSFQAATSGMYRVARATEDIQDTKKGIIRVDVDNLDPVA